MRCLFWFSSFDWTPLRLPPSKNEQLHCLGVAHSLPPDTYDHDNIFYKANSHSSVAVSFTCLCSDTSVNIVFLQSKGFHCVYVKSWRAYNSISCWNKCRNKWKTLRLTQNANEFDRFNFNKHNQPPIPILTNTHSHIQYHIPYDFIFCFRGFQICLTSLTHHFMQFVIILKLNVLHSAVIWILFSNVIVSVS